MSNNKQKKASSAVDRGSMGGVMVSVFTSSAVDPGFQWCNG